MVGVYPLSAITHSLIAIIQLLTYKKCESEILNYRLSNDLDVP